MKRVNNWITHSILKDLIESNLRISYVCSCVGFKIDFFQYKFIYLFFFHAKVLFLFSSLIWHTLTASWESLKACQLQFIFNPFPPVFKTASPQTTHSVERKLEVTRPWGSTSDAAYGKYATQASAMIFFRPLKCYFGNVIPKMVKCRCGGFFYSWHSTVPHSSRDGNIRQQTGWRPG